MKVKSHLQTTTFCDNNIFMNNKMKFIYNDYISRVHLK